MDRADDEDDSDNIVEKVEKVDVGRKRTKLNSTLTL